MNDIIEWSDPPPPKTHIGRVQQLKLDLQANPGQWAKIHSGQTAMPWWLALESDKNYELEVRTPGGLLTFHKDVWARYVGR